MAETSEQFLYEYSIVEIKQVNNDEVHALIAFYKSNAVPPEIDSLFNPVEFSSENGFHQYKVVNVMTTPRNTEEEEAASEITHITVYVQKVDKAD